MDKHRIYTEGKIRDTIQNYGFDLVHFNTTTDIVAKDCEGYKYSLNLCNLRCGKHPNKLQHNPFAIYNINHYLKCHCPNYKLLDDEYIDCKSKMRFICETHKDKGVQYNSVDNIMNNHHYCKYCSYEQMHNDRVLSEDKIKQLCAEKGVIFVGRYTKDHESQIQYICDKHKDKGVQEMSLTHFKQSNVPCKYCGISSGELRIKEFLDKNNIIYVKEKKFDDCIFKRQLRFDFYLPDKNVIIEYDGKQHFQEVTYWNGEDAARQLQLNKTRDTIKTQYCKDNNIKLLRISYKEYDNIEQILSFLI